MNTHCRYLVSCVGKKKSRPAWAEEFYTSSWFLKARADVESTGMPWFVRSAEHGLLSPGQRVSPYEKTLHRMALVDRRLWAQRVLRQLDAAGVVDGRVVFLAGQRYRAFLAPRLVAQGLEVEVPMEGLGIGQQLRWLTERGMG